LNWSVDLKEFDCTEITAISPEGGVVWYLTDIGTWTEVPTCIPADIGSSGAALPEEITGAG